jgi:magnesium/cobalt transport protein CorA
LLGLSLPDSSQAQAAGSVLPARTLPVPRAVVGGRAVITTPAAGARPVLTVDQATQRAIIDWKSFNISRDSEVIFRQPNSTASALNRIYSAKRSMMNLRRAGWPLRELASSLERSDSELIQESSRIYLRDLYDHAVEIIDVIENMRDISSGMIDVYLSSMSHKLNEVMKVLTIIATIFMPLTFLSSIYGMNFAHMPELQMAWGYPAILLLMLGVAITMLAYFRRKQWI